MARMVVVMEAKHLDWTCLLVCLIVWVFLCGLVLEPLHVHEQDD